MRVIIGFIYLCLLTLSSCDLSSDAEGLEAPESLMPRAQFTEVLVELSKLEAHIESTYKTVTVYNIVMTRSGDSLLQTFDLDKETFEASMGYYGSRQEEMKDIYSDVLDELNLELGKLESEKIK